MGLDRHVHSHHERCSTIFFCLQIYESQEWQIHRWKVRFDVKMEVAWNAEQQYKRWGMQHGQIYADD
ncbi:hypothetical protein PAESOLCIP111_05877 [Paenibacillus solanacearum]|uniref:Uncharacterized protein n=1 Tax=Paenibacillus solanacearum TaxID=2048548 RepID=A0A916K9W9_9BACL|nr:hypothetical protein PAESOLCIP111_05877 [Paenibacillus solanacearum]